MGHEWIELRLAQAAIAVAEELNFSRAAVRLHLTQPALSKQIQDLERLLGVVLFERNSQSVELTEACRGFIEEVRLGVLHFDRAVHVARSIARGAEAVLHLGTSPYVDAYLVHTLLAVRLPLFPTLRIHASSNFSPELSRQVLTGELNVALFTAALPNPRLNYLEVDNSPFYVVFSKRDGIAWKPTVRLKDVSDRVWVLFGRHIHPMLYDELMSRSRNEQAVPKEIHHVTSAEEAAHLVRQQDGVAILTKGGSWRIATGNLTMRPLAEDGIRLSTTLVTRADDRSRLSSEYLRAAMTKIESGFRVTQRRLPLTG